MSINLRKDGALKVLRLYNGDDMDSSPGQDRLDEQYRTYLREKLDLLLGETILQVVDGSLREAA